jgi:hypothetical protein
MYNIQLKRRNEMNSVAKAITKSLVMSAIGVTLNVLLDKKLAKSKNPGFINRSYRKMLRVTRNPYYVAAVVVGGVALEVATTVQQEQQYQRALDNIFVGQ